MPFASEVADLIFTIKDFRKLGNFKTIPKMPGIKAKSPSNYVSEMKILTVALENCKKSPLKHFTKNIITLNLENFSTIYCPRL